MYSREELKQMECGDLFSIVSGHMTTALMFHNSMIDYFNFLGLCGFKRLHQYQYCKESDSKKKLHSMYIKTTNKLIKPAKHGFPDVIPEEWYSHTRMDIDDGLIAKYVRRAWKMYREWEEGTEELYKTICIVLHEKGMLYEYETMKQELMDVKTELIEIYKIQERLNSVGFDSLYIMDMQNRLHEKYKKKMNK